MTWSNILHELWNVANKYYVIAGIAFLVFYVLLRKRIFWKKIQPRFPNNRDYRRELIFSTISIVIFSLPPIILLHDPRLKPHTTLYKNISLHGWWYFFGIFPLLFLMHDTYFYWMHRLIHHPRLFRRVHLVHHRSVNPSPLAAYAFHPVEAFLESMIFVIFLFTIPITAWHLLIFFVISLSYNVYGHLGYELYPEGFSRHWLGRWLNTSVSHNLHHHHFNGNYGLYFLFWDRAMGTLRVDYDEAFGEVMTRERTNAVAGGGKSVTVAAVLLLAAAGGLNAQTRADDILGVWQTHGDKPARIQVFRSGDRYDGKIIYLQYPNENGKPMTDRHNPDKTGRQRPILGLNILNAFRFDKDEWTDGHIDDPESGKTYSCTMALKDANTLKVRGYVGISWIGRTEVWTRVVK